MPLIVNGVTRFTVEQSIEGNEVANILDMRIDTTGTTTNRNDAIQDQASVIFEQWATHMLGLQVDDLTLDAVRWVDLDSATGSTGSVVEGGTFSAPVPGVNTGSPLPSNTAALIRKTLESAGRGRRAGRMYLCGLTETMTTAADGNLLEPANLATFTTALASFLSAINQEGGGFYDYDSALSVVHVLTRDENGKPLTGTSSDVGALVPDPLLATQRRRLRR